MLTLYFAPGACSGVPHIALEEAGATFEARTVALRKGEQRSAEYQKINPKGKVPVLAIDGKPLTEIVAIMTYIARAFPDAKLLPTGDLRQEMDALSMLAWCASGVQPVLGRFFGPAKVCDIEGSQDAVLRLARAENEKNFGLIEQAIGTKDWVFDRFSAIDCYLYVFYNWALFHKIDVSAFPHYTKHHERMNARPSVQRAMAREAEARKAMEAAA